MDCSDMTSEERKQWQAAMSPIHLGEILQEDFLNPLGMTRRRLALELGVPAPRINEICRGERSITADTALRLGRYFNVSPEMWLGFQNQFDLAVARTKLGNTLDHLKSRPLA